MKRSTSKTIDMAINAILGSLISIEVSKALRIFIFYINGIFFCILK